MMEAVIFGLVVALIALFVLHAGALSKLHGCRVDLAIYRAAYAKGHQAAFSAGFDAGLKEHP